MIIYKKNKLVKSLVKKTKKLFKNKFLATKILILIKISINPIFNSKIIRLPKIVLQLTVLNGYLP